MSKTAKRRKILAIIFYILTVAATVYIIFNGAQSGPDSSARSEKITEVVEVPLDKMEIKYKHETVSHYVRKTAHFTEYFALAFVFAAATFFTFKKKFIPAVAVEIYCAVLAFFDEFYLQKGAHSRSPQFTDVLIDASGALIAIFLVALCFYIGKKRREKKKKEQ